MIVYSELQPTQDLSARIQALLRSSGDAETATPFNMELDRDRVSTRLMDIFRNTGNVEAYDLLFDLNKTRLRRFIGHRLRHLSLVVDASDILQEAFFNIYRYPYRFRADRDSAFRVWTGAIVTNIIRRHLRRYFVQMHELSYTGEENSGPEILDLKTEPAKLAMEGEDIADFGKVFAVLLWFYVAAYKKLPKRDRQILQMVELENKRYREVGELLSIRADNVKMLVFRARQRFFKLLSESMEVGANVPALSHA